MSDDTQEHDPFHEQPPLPNVPADEQHAYENVERISPLPRILVVGGAAMISGAVIGWKHMGIDFPYEGWQRFLPALTFMAALIGSLLVGYGVYITMLEPAPVSENKFAAWGRFGLGIAFTFVGILAKNALIANKKAPPEALAVAMMCMISGPVICAWACYGTFVKDRSQRDTGLLMMAALATFLMLILWG